MATLILSARRLFFVYLVLTALISIGITSTIGAAQPIPGTQSVVQTASYKIEGHGGLVFRYGFGDGRGFTNPDHSLGLFFNQTYRVNLRVDTELDAPAAGNLALIAQLDNSKPDFLQSVRMIYEADAMTFEFGDFPMGRTGTPFALSSRLLKGFKMNWFLSEDLTISAIHAQVSGNFETRTFRGSTVESSVLYAYYPPDQPFAEKPYSTNLDGLEYFELGPSFVEGFSTVQVSFLVDNELRSLLEQYELGYLFDSIGVSQEVELEQDIYYTIIPTDREYYLALKMNYIDILRELLFELIDDFNESSGLPVDEWRDYPFYQDTDFEREFLERLSLQTELRVDEQILDPEESQNRRFYSLPAKNIVEESLSVEILRDGEYAPVDDPSLVGYEMELYSEIGILEFNFPPVFFEERGNAIQVEYSYDQASSGFYVLGTNVLRNSEKVYLNDELLQRDADYFVIYESLSSFMEVANLILLNPLGEEDVLRIEYEIARSGFGGFSQFGRSYTSLNFHSEPIGGLELDIDLMQAHDSLKEGVDLESLQTMPNTHTVLGISGKFTNDILNGSFNLGVSQNLFPPDDNLRVNQPNFIHTIEVIELAGRTLTLFGHRNGLHVFDGVSWTHYGVQEGLAGQEVYDIDFSGDTLYIATSGGLSSLTINPGNPMPSFARKRNWNLYDERDGVPGTNVNAVLVDGSRIWVGTDQALGVVELEQITDFEQWRYFQRADYRQMPSDLILHLEKHGSYLYVGTDSGLFTIDDRTDNVSPIANLENTPINELISTTDAVFAATERGVFEIMGAQAARSVISATPVNSIARMQGELWYATDDGLYGAVSGRVRVTSGRPITAIASTNDSVWAGERANEDYQLFLYDVRRPSDYRLYQDVETRLDGRTRNRYQDIPREGHRDHGIFGRLALNKSIGDLRLQGSLEGVTPQFSPVGAFNRQDHLRLNLTGIYPIAPGVELRAVHEEGLYDIFEEPTINITDIVGIDIAPANTSTEIQVSSTERHVDADFETEGFDRRDHSFSSMFSQNLFGNLINLRLGFDRDESENIARPLYTSSESELWSDIEVHPLPSLAFGTGYRLPSQFQFGQRSREHILNWSVDWTKDIPFVGFTLEADTAYSGNVAIPIGPSEERRSLIHNGSVTLRSGSVRIGSLRLSPNINVDARAVNPLKSTSTLDLKGSTTLDVDLFGFDGSFSLTKSYLSQQRNELTTHRDGLNIFVRYLGFADIDPSISFTGGLNTLIHPLFGRKVDGNYSIATGLAWSSAGPFSADLTIARDYRKAGDAESVTLSLEQTIKYRLAPGILPSLEMGFDYRDGVEFGEDVNELNGTVTLGVDLQILDGWTAFVSSMATFGLDSLNERGNTSSYLLEFSLGRDFSLTPSQPAQSSPSEP